MHQEYLMGNEAIARGALAAGVNLVAGYPGTPSTEVLENVAKHRTAATYVEWSVNEKTAMEVAAGAAYAGARVMVTMKQVGLNVASDPLMSLEYVGLEGAMVVLVADDPGPISSQTEQDTRRFAGFSKLPCFDPSDPAEAYEMIQEAFELSEKYKTPVFMRPTTRIDHGYAAVDVKDPEEYLVHPVKGFVKDTNRWVIFPKLSYAAHGKIEARNEALQDEFSAYARNKVVWGGNDAAADACVSDKTSAEAGKTASRKGVITHGASFGYTMEALKDFAPVPVFRVATPYPFPEKKAVEFLRDLDEVLVIEELDPVLEDAAVYVAGKYGLSVKILGKRTHNVRFQGENTVDLVKGYLGAFLKPPVAASAKTTSAADAALSEASPSTTSAADAALSEASPSTASATTSAFSAAAADAALPALPVRPPVLCAGCPHRASFYAVKQAMKGRKTIFCGDIGCYTLGNAAPLDMTDTCLCMGAAMGIAQGVFRMEPDTSCFAFAGDSTFFASAIPGVINALYNHAEVTFIVLDNSTTAMTGHQPHPGTGETMMGDVAEGISIEGILRGIGLTFVETVNPLELSKAVDTVRRAAAEPGVKAIIFKYPCIAKVKKGQALRVDPGKCIGCTKCIREIGCPGISLPSSAPSKVTIDPGLCTGCGLCAQVCPVGAIGGADHE